MEEQNFWRKCGSCKKEIGYNSIYQACSVSSCSKFVFCSVECWDMHNPVMNHKSAWAEENRSPAKAQQEGRRIIIPSTPSVSAPSSHSGQGNQSEEDILIVVSKLKNYIKHKFDMNTSANVMEILSDKVRQLTDQAVMKAKREGRKTLMDRDF